MSLNTLPPVYSVEKSIDHGWCVVKRVKEEKSGQIVEVDYLNPTHRQDDDARSACEGFLADLMRERGLDVNNT